MSRRVPALTLLAWAALIALSAWCLFLPQPELLAIGPLIWVPWGVIVSVSLFRRQIALFPDPEHPSRRNLVHFALIPGLVLAMRALRDFPFAELTDPLRSLLPVLLAGSALMTIVAALASGAAPSRHRSAVVYGFGVCAGCMLYLAASALLLNRDLDDATAPVYRTMVMEKNIVRNRAGVLVSYQVGYRTYWNRHETSRVFVTPEVYEALSLGDYGCLAEHPGRWQIPWLEARDCAPPATAAVQAPRPVVQNRLLVDLTAGRYDRLNQYFNDMQRKYERREVGEQELFDAIHGNYEDASDNDYRYAALVAAYPDSYATHLLRGVHLYRVGIRARGGALMRDVAPNAQQRMRESFRAAYGELQASLNLTARPYLSTLFLLDIAQQSGNMGEQRRWLDLAIAVEPGNLLVRRRYMVGLEPRWGGSYADMAAFLEQCRTAGLPHDALFILESVIYEDKGDAQNRTKEYAPALQSWNASIDLYRQMNKVPPAPVLEGSAVALIHLGREAEAMARLEELLKAAPESPWAHAQLGSYYTTTGRYAQAWAHLQEGARLSDPWSELAVGMTLYKGAPDLHIAADQQAGLQWIRKAADQGDYAAAQFLRAH